MSENQAHTLNFFFSDINTPTYPMILGGTPNLAKLGIADLDLRNLTLVKTKRLFTIDF